MGKLFIHGLGSVSTGYPRLHRADYPCGHVDNKGCPWVENEGGIHSVTHLLLTHLLLTHLLLTHLLLT